MLKKGMNYATEMYCLFLQSVLTGKDKDVYCVVSTSQWLTMGESERILQVNQLVPEAYHQKFRNMTE